MAGLSSKQRHAITAEIQTLALACRMHIDDPDDIDDSAHKTIVDIIGLTKVLLCEILPNEFISGLRNNFKKAYYRQLLLADAPKGKGKTCKP